MLLYRFRCYGLIYGWLIFSVGSLLFMFGGYVGQGLLEAYGLPLSSEAEPVFYSAVGVFAAVGSALVFWAGAHALPSLLHAIAARAEPPPSLPPPRWSTTP